jgi:diguanylate cyclase
MTPESIALILLAILVASACQLILGGYVGWSLCRNRFKAAAAAAPPPPPPVSAIIDDQQARELLARLHQLAEGMASDVGEHNANVRSVDDELRALPEGDGSPLQNMLLGAVSKVIASNERLQDKLAKASEKIQEQTRLIDARMAEARTDALTGLANRRALDDELARREHDRRDPGTASGLLMLDVDHFKKLNDRYGHQAGDEVLRGVAQVMSRTLGDCGLVARFGGEEMAVVFQGAEAISRLRSGAEQLRLAIESRVFRHEGTDLRVTASIGVAELAAGETPAGIIKRADEALYASKRAGRNCVHFHNGQGCEAVAKTVVDAGDSSIDELTGLPTRAAFTAQLTRRVSEWRRNSNPVSLGLIEIDNLSALRQQHDHATGDLVLKAAARFLTAALRDMDLVARHDDETFAILLPGANATAGKSVAERVRTAVEACRSLRTEDDQEVTFTISAGVSEVVEGDDAERVMDRAKAALRMAVSQGRNRTHVRELALVAART